MQGWSGQREPPALKAHKLPHGSRWHFDCSRPVHGGSDTYREPCIDPKKLGDIRWTGRGRIGPLTADQGAGAISSPRDKIARRRPPRAGWTRFGRSGLLPEQWAFLISSHHGPEVNGCEAQLGRFDGARATVHVRGDLLQSGTSAKAAALLARWHRTYSPPVDLHPRCGALAGARPIPSRRAVVGHLLRGGGARSLSGGPTRSQFGVSLFGVLLHLAHHREPRLRYGALVGSCVRAAVLALAREVFYAFSWLPRPEPCPLCSWPARRSSRQSAPPSGATRYAAAPGLDRRTDRGGPVRRLSLVIGHPARGLLAGCCA